MENVFVYGTLKQGFGNHRVLNYGNDTTTQFVGHGYVRDYEIYDSGFPVMIPGRYSVLGEIYRVNPTVMEALDRLEGNGTMYLRKFVPVTITSPGEGFQSGSSEAWTYLGVPKYWMENRDGRLQMRPRNKLFPVKDGWQDYQYGRR